MITLIGLGPAHAGAMSVAARDALRAAAVLLLRTEHHPAAEDLRAAGIAFESLDSLYDAAATFDSLYSSLADRVVAAGRSGDVAYAVPGHPLVGEESVRRILDGAAAVGIPVRVVGSESFIEASLTALGISLADGIVVLDALSHDRIPARGDLGVLLYQVYDRQIASAAKLALMAEYPDDAPIRIVRLAGGGGAESVEEIPLHRLDRVPIDHLTSVYVPPLPPENRKKRFEDLVDVMARLRAPDGCPWDREQDHRTLKRYLIEECYEAIDAIDSGDMTALEEELGDVLLQVVFHAQLEAEEAAFTIDDVIAHIVTKLLRRHPHVFGDVSVENADEVLRNWEKIKRSEKGEGWRESVLDGVPSQMPALMRAMEISKRAVKVGFEWERFEDVFAKMEEEIEELRAAILADRPEDVQDEIGDLLFTLVNVARWQKVDPEEALRSMLGRFAARFRHIERRARDQGRRLEEMSLTELDTLWNEAKAAKPGSAQPPRTTPGEATPIVPA